MNTAKGISWIAGALAFAGVGAALLPPGKVRGLDLDGFGRIPVLERGRVKPMDSLARNSLLLIRGRQSFQHLGRTVGADEWLLDVMFRPDVAAEQQVFVIDAPEVLGLMGLQQQPSRYFALKTLAPHFQEIQLQASAATSGRNMTSSSHSSAPTVRPRCWKLCWPRIMSSELRASESIGLTRPRSRTGIRPNPSRSSPRTLPGGSNAAPTPASASAPAIQGMPFTTPLASASGTEQT